jgi:hypothetical protein
MIKEINSFVGFRESIIKNEIHEAFKELALEDNYDFVTVYRHSSPIKRYELIQSILKSQVDYGNKDV